MSPRYWLRFGVNARLGSYFAPSFCFSLSRWSSELITFLQAGEMMISSRWSRFMSSRTRASREPWNFGPGRIRIGSTSNRSVPSGAFTFQRSATFRLSRSMSITS